MIKRQRQTKPNDETNVLKGELTDKIQSELSTYF